MAIIQNREHNKPFILPLSLDHFRQYKKGQIKKTDIIDDKNAYIKELAARLILDGNRIETELFFPTSGRVKNYILVRLLIAANMPRGIKMRDLTAMTGLPQAAIIDVLVNWGAVNGYYTEDQPIKLSRFNFIRRNQFRVLPRARRVFFIRDTEDLLQHEGLNAKKIVKDGKEPVFYTRATGEYIVFNGNMVYYVNTHRDHIKGIKLLDHELNTNSGKFGRVFQYYKNYNQVSLTWDDLINLPKVAFHLYKDVQRYDNIEHIQKRKKKGDRWSEHG